MRILYTICGSISAYKSYDIVRALVNEGNEVKVILTKGALEFIKPQTFLYLGAQDIYTHEDDFQNPKNFNQYSKEGNILHINLARWCEKLVIAPASANTIANLSMGKATDLVSTLFLALEPHKPVLIFPAMNTQMLQHTLVQENLDVLTRLKKVNQVQIMPTQSGELACGEIGQGKLLETEKIIDLIDTFTLPMENRKKILIVTGASISPVDSVRYLTNPSSGVTGYYLAKEGLKRGHQVTLLAGKYSTEKVKNFIGLRNFKLQNFTSTSHLKNIVESEIQEHDAYLSPAAIGDIEFKMSEVKLKKSALEDSLPILKAPDILKEVINNNSNKYIVGFAAESELSEKLLLTKYEQKPVNLLIGTKVSNGLETQNFEGFQKMNANYAIVKKSEIEYKESWSKIDLAKYILNSMEEHYAH